MSTTKIFVIIGVIVVVIFLVVAVFIGGIIGFALYSVSNSEAATVAKNFLRENDRLKQDIGTVKDFGSIITGNINIDNAGGSARLNLKVIGETKTVNAAVQLLLQRGEWHVTEANYVNEAGDRVDLLPVYEGRIIANRPTPIGSSRAVDRDCLGRTTVEGMRFQAPLPVGNRQFVIGNSALGL